jgi:serine/threonine-protein kinase
MGAELAGPPPDDDVERRWIIAEAEARLFGGPRAPVRVGRFEVRARLGRGGFGVVYAAFDPELDREVALKLLRPDRSTGDDRERMMREARAMARLAHPNVVPIYEVGFDDGRVFLAMERVPGRTAREWLDEVKPSWREIVRVFVQAGRGLAAAHTAKLVHRDFKPENVLVGEDHRARVTDFGIAAPSDETAAGAGTPAYMAPEQRAGQPITPGADQFAFAIALHEALYGRRPAASDREPPAKSPVPRRIFCALERARAEAPGDRWPSLDALLDVLESPPQRRVLRIVIWSIVGVVLATALVGAILQMWMFRGWMSAARGG